MSTRALLVVEPGLLTTVQDLGRPGLASVGVPPSGVLDRDALRIANLLLGNLESAAGLEVAWQGPLLEARGEISLAVAGGRFGPAPLRVVTLRDGESLDLRRGGGDPACVVAVAGGLDVPVVLGSRS